MAERKKKTITGQVLNSIKINKLKCINGLNEIIFKPHALTAILGPNGSGKSTILHAIASIYMPEKGFPGEDHRLMHFFPRSPHAEWNGSDFIVNLTYRKDGVMIENELKNYGKADVRGSRWIQIYARRPLREVYYLGIDKCVPIIESEKKNNIQYETSSVSNDLITNILHYASYILNKPYTSFNQHQQPNGKILIGVESEGLAYSSLSMSAGEQKIFLILETILKADKNALILIDELDLLLHDEALKKLIDVISTHAEDKNKQIIFTTHREMVTTLSDKINIRHVVNIQGRSYSFEETKPDAINRLTGKSTTPIEIYVEDDLAVAIINKICSSLKASRYVKIFKFGAASNAFTLLASTLIRGDNLSDKLYILDGDKYSTENEKKTALDKVFTGTESRTYELKAAAEGKVKQFNLPNGVKPEQYIHYLITNVPLDGLGGEYLEIIEAARDIRVELDAHNYISNILTKLGIDRPSGLTRVMDLASRHPEWDQYVSEVTDWLQPVVSDLMERLPENDTVDIT